MNREFPGKLESSNLSRESLSGKIGHTPDSRGKILLLLIIIITIIINVETSNH